MNIGLDSERSAVYIFVTANELRELLKKAEAMEQALANAEHEVGNSTISHSITVQDGWTNEVLSNRGAIVVDRERFRQKQL